MDSLKKKQTYLLLCNVSPGGDVSTTVMGTLCAPQQKKFEAAGKAHHARCAATRAVPGGSVRAAPVARAVEEVASDIKELDYAAISKVDPAKFYDLLGLGDLNVNATDEQVRRAYRRIVLHLHPDKAANTLANANPGIVIPDTTADADGKTDKVFLAVQKAYDNLSNPEKRKAFDSQYEFDDSIPTGSEKGDFFTVYGPVFGRNSRFSVKQPVPKLGNLDSSVETVEAFYAFWFSFDSWREFSGGEHDPNDAEYRDEKRWMERQNKKESAKMKRADIARVAELVTRAYARDPRILGKKAREEEAKKAAHEAKFAAKRTAEKQAAQLVVELASMANCDEQSRKIETVVRRLAREKEKRNVKRAQKHMREAVAANQSYGISVEAMDKLYLGVESPEVIRLHQSMFGPEAYRVDVTGTALYPLITGSWASLVEVMTARGAVGLAAAPAAVQVQAVSAPLPTPTIAKKERPEWSVQELSALAKALARFPGGTRNRWKMVSDSLNSQGSALGIKHTRSAEECIAKSNNITDEDREKINAAAFELSQANVKAQASELPPGMEVSLANESATIQGIDAAELDVDAGVEGEPSDPSGGTWSAEQQDLLQAAMRKYPVSMEKNERWRLVSESVPGKSKRDCVSRAKALQVPSTSKQDA